MTMVRIGNADQTNQSRPRSSCKVLVRDGKGRTSKPKPPMAFAPRAQDPVRVGRVKHMHDHLDFGMVSGRGNIW
jgi:hypothetical protein